MTRDDALERALQVLREIASGNFNYADQMCWAAEDALTEIQRGLWIASVIPSPRTSATAIIDGIKVDILKSFPSLRYLGDEPSQHSEDWGDK